MTLIVRAREMRYGGKTYHRGEELTPANDRDAKLLTQIGKCAEAPPPKVQQHREAATVRPLPPAPPGEDATDAEHTQLGRLTNTNLRTLAAEEGTEVADDDTKASLVDKITANRYRTRRLQAGD